MEVAELLALRYPFGREHEASIQLLFRSFCNNIFIGQFEYARACLKELHNQRQFLRHPVNSILQKTIERWCKSVPGPDNQLHPLTWPCFIEYKELEDNKAQVKSFHRTLEFMYLTTDLCVHCDSEILEEISGLYKAEVKDISTQCQNFICSILIEFPNLAIPFLTFLQTSDVEFQINNILLDAVAQCYSGKNKNSLCILLAQAKLDLCTDGVKDRLEVILREMITYVGDGGESSWLQMHELNAALVSRADSELYTLAQQIYKEVITSSDECIKLCNKWRNIALDTTNCQTHFFDVVMSKASKLMKVEDYTELVTLLDTEEWRPLLPMILHLAWRQCNSTEQSHSLITAFSTINDPKLKTLIERHQRIDVIEQSLNLSSNTDRRSAENSAGRLSVENSQSVLHALLTCLDNLNTWSYQKMIKTLTAKSAYTLLKHSDSDRSDNCPLPIEQQRDINLFNSFFIINSVMQAMRIAADDTTDALSIRYKEEVLPLLTSAKSLLSQLRPLTLKLEVLEDLSMLLFAMGSDVRNNSDASETQLDMMSEPTRDIAEGYEEAPGVASDSEQYYTAKEIMTPARPSAKHKPPTVSGLIKAAARKLEITQFSENSTTGGAESTLPPTAAAVGFLANEFIVRDVLGVIKTALTDLTAANFEISNNTEKKSIEKELSRLTVTSVNELNFMSRSSQLQQRVSEAGWRYQLIVQDTVDKQFGTTVRLSASQDHTLDDEGYAVYERTVCNSSRTISGTSMKSGGTSPDSDLSSEMFASSSGATNLLNPAKNKRYRRRRNRQSGKVMPTKQGIICRMLSTPISLLNMCIKRQSYVQAGQVLKLYNLEESDVGKAFAFSRSYKKFVHTLSNDERPWSFPGGKPNVKTGGIDISFIRQAAANSLSTMDEFNKAQQLARAASLPADLNVKETQIVKFMGPSSPNAAVSTAMVLADLACSATADAPLCQQLLSAAYKSLNAPSHNRKSANTGLLSWLKQCTSINELALSLDQDKMGELLIRENDSVSIRSCLLSDLLSMEANEMQEQVTPLLKICDYVATIERAVKSWKVSDAPISEPLITSLPVNSLIEALNEQFPGNERSYLQDLYEQLQLLHQAITDNKGPNTTGPAPTYLSVLEEGPTMITGRLMFDNQVEPAKLEAVAKEVKLDLTHVIVRSCCAPVRCKPLPLSPMSPEDVAAQKAQEEKFGYRIILNGSSDNVYDINSKLSPLELVKDMLNMLLLAVEDQLTVNGVKLLTKEIAVEVAEREDYSKFCVKCASLQKINLSLLTNNKEKWAFFINLHNLISLHGVIENFSDANGTRHTDNSTGVSNVLAFQLRNSYIVGQLGVCSIFELQQFLLKASCKVRQLDLCLEHPWFCYAPEYSPLTSFLLYDGSINMLALNCVSAQSVENDVNDAVTKYMRHAVVIFPKLHQISIPELLMKVRSELIMETDSIPQYEHADVLLWILEYLPPTRWSELKLIMGMLQHQQESSAVSEKSTDEESESYAQDPTAAISVLRTNTMLGFSLDSSSALVKLSSCEEADEPANDHQSSYKLTRTDSILQQAKFKISDVAVQYLKEKSPIVAMLLDIIYEDMQLHGDTEEHFDINTLKTEYIHLYRYLEEYCLPLCTYIDEEIKSLHQMAKADLPSRIKAAILSHKSCMHLEHSARRCLDALCTDEKFGLVVSVIDKLNCLVAKPPVEWQALQDFASIQCASERVSNESLACIKRLNCERLQAHITISCLHESRWTVEKCLLLLPLCERRLVDKGDNYLVPHLRNIIERMSAFHRIMLHAVAKQDMVIEGCSYKVVQTLASGWQNVAELLVDEPSGVFHLLFDAQEFNFAMNLVKFKKNIDRELKLTVYRRYAVSSLDESESNTDDVISVLKEALHDDIDWCYQLCVQVLKELEKTAGMLVILDFMSGKMVDALGDKQKENVKLCHIGVQMLKCVDENCQELYRPLVFAPLLMFEQLLMNARIAWAEKVIRYLRNPTSTSTSSEQLDFTDDVNRLLVVYAEKAVDFPILNVHREVSGAGGGGSSVSPVLRNVRSLAKVGSPSKASPLQKALLGSSLRRLSPGQQSPRSQLSRITTAPGNLSTLANGSPTLLVSPLPEKTKKKFTIPERAPARHEWVTDDRAERCMLCHLDPFSMFNRRHHCRRCGRVVCASCSSRTAPVGGRSVRVCDNCYDSMFKSKEILDQQDPSVQKLREKLSGATPSPVTRTVNTFKLSLPEVQNPEWLLSTDVEENDELRSDFFFDHAPSVSLCTSMLKMYSNEIECAKHMLTLCEKLSQIIKPIRPETINQEVDYNLVISMMKFLLLNAKLMFVREHYADGVALCEVYNNRVDVLSLLLSNYYLDLPSVEELSKIDNIRRLRDRLMEDERPELALEISTKFGLETTIIWSSWGLDCLRKADYSGARDKFSKFLKPLMDKHSQTVAYSSVLTDIVSTLEGQAAQTNGTYTQASIESTLRALTSCHDLSKTVPSLALDGCQLDENLEHVQECVYYLKQYGNHNMLIKFYRTHGFWQKAVQYCIDKNCSSETFTHYLFLPAVREGDLSLLQDQLILIDSTLQKCNSYLTAVCRYLANNHQYYILYQMQLFTKDFIRAAMTCIEMFYLSNAKTYAVLAERSSQLTKALDHYQSYLNPLKWDKIPRPKALQQGRAAESSVRLSQSESGIRRQIGIVKLQMEVNKVMSGSSARETAITLFGNPQEILALASKVILAGKSVSEGFELAFRIIQEFQLSYNKVYTAAAHSMGVSKAYPHIKQLGTCIRESGLCDTTLLDQVLLVAIKAAGPADPSQSKQIESLVKLLHSESSKMEAHIMCGKLRSAYLLAIKSDSVGVIARIAEEAVRLNQTAVKVICDKYINKQTHPTSK